MKKCIVICGPTASGKTSLAIELCRILGGEVINADSRQVYRFMDIGTGKPSPEERKEIPHHLIDAVNPDERFDAGRFISMADRAYEDIVERGKIPFLVGGTGLYIRAFERGLIPAPPVPEEIKEELRRRREREGVESLYKELLNVDPETALKVERSDFPRIERALSYYLITGRKISEARKAHGFREKRYEVLKIYLEPPREILYSSIRNRIYDMIKRGWVEEVERLFKMGYTEDSPGFTSVGYREMAEVVKGKMQTEDAVELIYRRTKEYARRQIVWFRKEEKVRMDPENISNILRKVEEFYEIPS